jgi:hypothetical protein
MMSTKKVVVILASVVIAVALGSATGITTDDITSSVFAQEQKFTEYGPLQFTARLSAQEEVPPANSQATGTADFFDFPPPTLEFLRHFSEPMLEYVVNASNIENTGVTAGHIHSGKQGENGPVIATLWQYSIRTSGSITNEVSETGFITARILEGPMAGKQLSDLVTAMSNGETYVDIHTERNPNGEIRGQLKSSSNNAGGGDSNGIPNGGRGGTVNS